ncbi:MAG: hypothetical protein ACOYVF_06130, partial [Candidatus Zixiibacteriota bacterium]
GTVVQLQGRVGFEWARQVGLDTAFVEIDFYVADTVVGIVWDTVSTGLISLVVSSNGNMGNNYSGSVNMDFFGTDIECDDSSNYASGTTDTIPGDATVYLGDASPVILTSTDGGTTVTASWAIFGQGFEHPNGFKPVTGFSKSGVELSKPTHYEDSLYDCFHTGSFITIDSTLVLEITYYAPKKDTSRYAIIQMIRIWVFDSLPHYDVVIGEAFDWDIPSDTGSYNTAGTDPVNGVIYLVGGEYDEPHGDSLECIDNNTRIGGAKRLGYYTQEEYNADSTVFHTDPIWGGYTALNEDYVYPANGFVPEELWANMMANEGLNAQPSSVSEDQHVVLTYFNSYDFEPEDTLIIWVEKTTIVVEITPPSILDFFFGLINRIFDWFMDWYHYFKKIFLGCCVGTTGDANCSGSDPDISDITRLIDYLYLSHAPLCCLEEADANGSGGEPDISDITKLIDNLYLSHSALPDCP